MLAEVCGREMRVAANTMLSDSNAPISWTTFSGVPC